MSTLPAAAMRLQVGRGLWGVTKVVWPSWKQRNALSWLVAVAFLASGAAAVRLASGPGPQRPIAWVATGLLAAGVAARLLYEARTATDSGSPPPWDRRLVDPWWTTIHAATGAVLGLWSAPWWLVLALVVGWEVVEIIVPGFGDEEINGNRASDIVVALLGWLLASLLVG